MHFTFLIVIAIFALCVGKDLLQLQGDNFELALTSYKYIAILFYDDSKAGQSIRRQWSHAAQLLGKLPSDSEIAMVCVYSLTSPLFAPDFMPIIHHVRFLAMTFI